MRWIVLVGFTVLIIVIGFFLYDDFLVWKLPKEYRDLGYACHDKLSFSCCISSVRAMAESRATLQNEGKCPDNTSPNALRCLDSYAWCEPWSTD